MQSIRIKSISINKVHPIDGPIDIYGAVEVYHKLQEDDMQHIRFRDIEFRINDTCVIFNFFIAHQSMVYAPDLIRIRSNEYDKDNYPTYMYEYQAGNVKYITGN